MRVYLYMHTPWKRFSILYSIQFIQLLDFVSIASTGALFHKDSLISSHTIAFSLTAYSIAAIISSLLIRKAGSTNDTNLLSKLLLVFSLSQLLLFSNINDFSFIASRVIGGLTGGIIGAIAYSKLNLIDEGKNTGKWNGRIQTAQSFITLLGIPFAILMITKISPKAFYFLMFFSAIVLATILARTKAFYSSIAAPTKVSFKIRKNFDIISTGFLCYFSAFLFITNLPNYLINSQFISANQLSLGYTISGVLTILVSGKLGQLADKYNPILLLIISIVIITCIQFNFFQENAFITTLILLPTYLLFSTSRMIYQRSIILRKTEQDSASMHLLNNICIRAGILCSGLVTGLIAINGNVKDGMNASNNIAIVTSILTVIILIYFYTSEQTKGIGVQK